MMLYTRRYVIVCVSSRRILAAYTNNKQELFQKWKESYIVPINESGYKGLMIMWRIFSPWRIERACEWRKIHNEVLNDLYYSPKLFRLIKPRRIKLARHVARVGNWRVFYRGLVGKPEGKCPIGRPNLRRESIIKTLFQEPRNSVMS